MSQQLIMGSLNRDCRYNVLSNVGLSELVPYRGVSRSWKEMIDNDPRWKELGKMKNGGVIFSESEIEVLIK